MMMKDSVDPRGRDRVELAGLELPDENRSKPPTLTVPINVRNAALSLIAGLAVILVLRFAQAVLIPIVLSILIVYALDPVVKVVTRCKIPRAVAAALVLMGLVAGLTATAYSLRFQVVAALESLPKGARKLRETIEAARPGTSTIDKVKTAANEIEKTASAAAGAASAAPPGVARVQVEEPTFRASDYLWSGSMEILAGLGQGVLIFFMVYFLLASGDLYKRKLIKLVGPTLSQKRLPIQILDEISAQIERFLFFQMCTSLLVAVVTGTVLWLLGVHQPAVWGLVAGVLNFIPYFGPIIASGALALVAFLQFGTLLMTVCVSGVAFLITSLEGFLLTPKLMGRASGINQVALFISLLFWSWMWGAVGIILAVPIMMVVKSICDRVEGLDHIAELLGEKAQPVSNGSSQVVGG